MSETYNAQIIVGNTKITISGAVRFSTTTDSEKPKIKRSPAGSKQIYAINEGGLEMVIHQVPEPKQQSMEIPNE